MTVKLRGMTWNHPRGYEPLAACSLAWADATGVEIAWDKRSLQDFETYPVEDLARRYDLIVVDHPHVGQITGETCLVPLDVPGRAADRDSLARGSVGLSYPSYAWDGRQWAFPIDAATQVQAWRPDRLDGPATSWDAVVALARDDLVLCPLRPPHSLMCLYTLAANLGSPCSVGSGPLVESATGAKVYDMIAGLVGLIDPACFDMDPIAVSERMAAADSPIACAPLIYGYVSYALDGFRPARLRFADLPVAGRHGPVGSALGGTGIAVSAFSRHREAAIDFAYWVASGPVQRGLYAAAGGQPGHAEAWTDDDVNAPVANFYHSTRATLEGAWLRPRHDGYMPFQHWAASRLNEGLRRGEAAGPVLAAINRAFADSFTGRT